MTNKEKVKAIVTVFTEEQVRAALKLSNVAPESMNHGYDIEMCSEFFLETLRKLGNKKQRKASQSKENK